MGILQSKIYDIRYIFAFNWSNHTRFVMICELFNKNLSPNLHRFWYSHWSAKIGCWNKYEQHRRKYGTNR